MVTFIQVNFYKMKKMEKDYTYIKVATFFKVTLKKVKKMEKVFIYIKVVTFIKVTFIKVNLNKMKKVDEEFTNI